MADDKYNEPQRNFIKIIVVGDGTVGKTCMLMVYNQNKFPTGYVPTVFDNYASTITINDKTYTVSLFDTAGQESFDRLRPLAYHGTHVFLICYAIDSESSYQNVKKKWVPEIRNFNKTTPIIIVGTKTDKRNCATSCDNLTKQRGSTLATEMKVFSYMECSSLKNENVKEVFDAAIYLSISKDKESVVKKSKKENCKVQ